jgi:hypothetical protein
MTQRRLGPGGRARRWLRYAIERRGIDHDSAVRSQLDEIAARLAERSSADGDTARRLDLISAEMEELIRRLDVLATGQEDLAKQVAPFGHRLGSTQALVARTYENASGLTAGVDRMRDAAGYDAPYAGEPLVTVVVPTYNRADTLCGRALASLRRQTYPNWEAVVVGDACTDDSGERIHALGDSRIHWENLAFRGPYPDDESDMRLVAGTAAVERCLARANGLWLAHLDDDDEWDDDHLEVLLAEAMRSRAEVVYGRWRQRDARTARLVDREFGEWPLRFEQFAFQAAIYHHGLRAFPPDINARLAGEAGDWNRVRRFWEAGVRFAFVDRAVTTIWFMPRDDEAARRFQWVIDTFGHVDESAG